MGYMGLGAYMGYMGPGPYRPWEPIWAIWAIWALGHMALGQAWEGLFRPSQALE